MRELAAVDNELIAMCGAYCGSCGWKEKTGCGGCKACKGDMFWGECSVAKCGYQKGFSHCGVCPELPCEALQGIFDDAEHGDEGERLANLKAWARGENTFVKLPR